MRGLADEFNESTKAIRIELNRLEKAGLMTAAHSGNKKMYQANTCHSLMTHQDQSAKPVTSAIQPQVPDTWNPAPGTRNLLPLSQSLPKGKRRRAQSKQKRRPNDPQPHKNNHKPQVLQLERGVLLQEHIN